jgi:hypothetical protein
MQTNERSHRRLSCHALRSGQHRNAARTKGFWDRPNVWSCAARGCAQRAHASRTSPLLGGFIACAELGPSFIYPSGNS